MSKAHTTKQRGGSFRKLRQSKKPGGATCADHDAARKALQGPVKGFTGATRPR